MIKKIKDCLIKIIETITYLLLVTVVATVFISVCSRYLFHFPLFWADEIARMSCIWMVMFGSIVGIERNTHFNLDYFYNKFSRKIARVASKITLFFSSIFLIILCWEGIDLCRKILGVKSAGLGIPMYLFYLAMPVGSFLMLIYLFLGNNQK